MTGKPVQFGRLPYDILTSGALISVKPAAMKIYALLCVHSDSDWQSKVGVRTLVAESGYQPATVCESIKQLRGLGLIQTNERKNGQPYIYTIVTHATALLTNRLVVTKQPTVQQPPNGQANDRLAPADQTVQQPPNQPFSAHRETVQSALNVTENREETDHRNSVVDALRLLGIRQVNTLADTPGVTTSLIADVKAKAGTVDLGTLHNQILDAAKSAMATEGHRTARERYDQQQAEQRRLQREEEKANKDRAEAEHKQAVEAIAGLDDNQLTELRDAHIETLPAFLQRQNRIPTLDQLRQVTGGLGLRAFRVQMMEAVFA